MLTDQLRRLDPCPEADNTTPIVPIHGKTPLHGRRFVYGFSLDGSDFPCCLLWPVRTQGNSFWLLESQTHRYVDLEHAGFLRPLGIRHFYDGFSLRAVVSIRTAAVDAFQFKPDEVASDLIISTAAAVARGWAEHQEQPVDQHAPEADRRNVPDDVISVRASEVDSDGDESSYASYSYASYSGDSSASEPPVSEVSDQILYARACLSRCQRYIAGHQSGQPCRWRCISQCNGYLSVAMAVSQTDPAFAKFGLQRLDRLVACYLMELMATHSDVSQCRKRISSFAKVLTVRVAMNLAKLIASLLRPVLYHPRMKLADDDTIALLSSEFWVRPVYEELLHAASRFNLSPAAEYKRPTSNLVKIASHVKEKPRDSRNQHALHTTMTDWLGADCPVDYLNVWFPPHCAPLVFKELQDRETKYRKDHRLWFDAPAQPTDDKKTTKEASWKQKVTCPHS